MQIVPVVDLKHGKVVRGIGGRRSEYRPIVSSLTTSPQPGDVARAFATNFGAETIYIADLDAIEHGEPDLSCWQAIAAHIPNLWIDAGIGSTHQARFVAETIARSTVHGSVVVGLESLKSSRDLPDLAAAGGPKPIFSLDLREGHPIVRIESEEAKSPIDWAAAAYEAGFRRLIVLDLADVGSGHGSRTLELCREVKRRWPELEVIGGGGVRHAADLQQLAAAGCQAALVASALHDGRITPDDWATIAEQETPSSDQSPTPRSEA